MIKKLTITFIAIFCLFLSFCTRSVSDANEQNAILSKSELAALNDDPPVEDKKYLEKACITGNCAGTLCEAGKGTCTKERPCTAIPGGCTNPDPEPEPIPDTIPQARISSQDIETLATQHATKMVKDGYIEKKDFEISKKLAKDILTKVRSK